MIYGYARVSTKEQNLERQLQQLRQYIADDRYIIVDKASGKDFVRCGYNLLIGTSTTAPLLHNGDTLIIVSLDRLGRNYAEIHKQWDFLTNTLQVNIQVLDMPVLNTSVDNANLDKRFISDLILQILSYTAEKERKNIRIRQRQGIDAMKIIDGKRISAKTGRPTGRPSIDYPADWTDVYNKWISKEITAVTAMQRLGLKKNTFYKLANKYKSGVSSNIHPKRKPIRKSITPGGNDYDSKQ